LKTVDTVNRVSVALCSGEKEGGLFHANNSGRTRCVDQFLIAHQSFTLEIIGVSTVIVFG